MMTSAEMKFVVPNGWVVNEEMMPDGSRVFTIKPDTFAEKPICNQQKGLFRKVPASELRLDDDFMDYYPQDDYGKTFKKQIRTAIKKGLKDFWIPVCAPSFDSSGAICYQFGEKIAVGKSYNWWEKNAKKYAPERGSRLGVKDEYLAFVAVLIKEMVASGKSLEWAWEVVNGNSEEIGGRYIFYKEDITTTAGSNEVCGWYDLLPCRKFIAGDKSYWLTSTSSLTDKTYLYKSKARCSDRHTYGWLVFDSCPDC